MSKFIILFIVIVIFSNLIFGCLITNCPRGGKRNGKFLSELNVKPCISCGPGHSGQCFGPNICCGPFGCLMGTPETIKCQREGLFYDNEPCIAGNGNCKRNRGRCAFDGVCCSQDSCHADKTCSFDDKIKQIPENLPSPLELYNVFGYQGELEK